jgi:hypothetical protein
LPEQRSIRVEFHQQGLAIVRATRDINRTVRTDRNTVAVLKAARGAIDLLQQQCSIGGVLQQEYVGIAADAEARSVANSVYVPARCHRNALSAVEVVAAPGLLKR